jgi:hypothetical protein
MEIWYVFWPIGNFYGHLVHFVVIWDIFSRFGMLHKEKSGNPASYEVSCCTTFLRVKKRPIPKSPEVSKW